MAPDDGIIKKIENTITVKIINEDTEPRGWEAAKILLPLRNNCCSCNIYRQSV